MKKRALLCFAAVVFFYLILINFPFSVMADKVPEAGQCEAFYEIPHELKADYYALTGNGDEKSNILNLVEGEGSADDPLFQVTLPGAPRDPEPPISTHNKTDMPNTLLNGEAPLYEGAKILRNEIFGNNHSIEIEVPATPDDVFEFYKASMTVKGWSGGMAMKEKERGMLFFSRRDQELVFRIEKFRQNTRVTINLVNKERFNMRQNQYNEP